MVSKPTRILTLVVCIWVVATAGVASNAEPTGPQVATSSNASLGICTEGRSNLRIGSRAQRPARSYANW